MSDVKNFGLTGVGSEVQLGKGGAKVASENEKIVAKNKAGQLTNVQAADPVAAQDVVTKLFLDAKTGADFTLGGPSDGSLTDGAVQLNTTTSVTNAVDALNGILGKLIPVAPTNFPAGQALVVASVGTSPLLASGTVPNNTNGGSIPSTAGNSVTRVTAATVSTNIIGSGDDVGPGDTGTLTALVNNAAIDSAALSTGSNNKTGVLTITNDQAFPASTPGFWESFRSQIVGASVAQGWNRLKLNHTVGATNDVYFVRDNLTTNPVVSNGSVTENTAGTYSHSSGIPHYGVGGVLTVNFDASNIAGETYKSGTILSVAPSTSGGFSTINYAAGAAGLPNPVPRQTLAHSATGLSVPVNGTNFHNTTQVSATASNPNGSGSATFGPIILVKAGTTTRVDEMNMPLSIAVNGGPNATVATRVDMTAGDNPADDKTALTTGDWASAAVADGWDAAVVGGILKHDLINYTTGYLPVGPNRSAFAADQYATFLIRRTAVSKFDIAITGTYAGLWVKLAGESDKYTTTANGWYSMKTLYGGAGRPGDRSGANGSLGCALGAIANGTGSWTCTFGTLSSTDAINNNILVRVKLTAGQSITALSFVPATR